MDSLYVNIGTERCCLFVKMSRRLLTALYQNPTLHFAIEESILSAQAGHFAIGILAISQIMNALGKPKHSMRNAVAHEFLRIRATQLDFDQAMSALKDAASEQCMRELARCEDKDAYSGSIARQWMEWVRAVKIQIEHEPTPHPQIILETL